MIALNTWWTPSGVAYIAVRLADLAQEMGHPSRIVSRKYHEKGVHNVWDKKVIPETNSEAQNTLMKCKVAIWPEVIWDDHVILARAYKARTYLIPMWETINQKNRTALSYYTSLMCPSKATTECFKRQGITNVEYLPYDPGVPRGVRKIFDGDNLSFLMPVAGAQPRRNAAFMMQIMARIMRDYPKLRLTITHTAMRWPPSLKEDLIRLRIAFRDRVVVHANLSYEAHLKTYGNHDLTLWPTEQEGLGIIGGESLSCGTPVAALNIPPINEYLTDGKDSILVPCKVRHNWFGVPTGKADPKEFENVLRELLDKPWKLEQLVKHTNGLPPQISTLFQEGWRKVFGGDNHQTDAARPEGSKRDSSRD